MSSKTTISSTVMEAVRDVGISVAVFAIIVALVSISYVAVLAIGWLVN